MKPSGQAPDINLTTDNNESNKLADKLFTNNHESVRFSINSVEKDN